MNKIIFVLISAIFLGCKSNNYIRYHNLCNKAELSFYNSNYSDACKKYSRAFRKVNEGFDRDKFQYSASLWEVGAKMKSIQYLKENSFAYFGLNVSGYFQGIDSIALINVLKIKAKKYRVNKVDSVFMKWDKKDKESRIKFLSYVNSNEILDSLVYNSLKQEVLQIDSLFELVVDSIISVDGFIESSNPRLLHKFLLHHPRWVIQNKKWLVKSIKRGDILPVDYAISYDKALRKTGSPVGYFNQFSSQTNDAEPKEIMKRSRKLGVSPYFVKWIDLLPKKGDTPDRHKCFGLY